MRTERVERRSESGFTLIEVLVAVLVLSVGLVGIGSLGNNAARSIAAAERRDALTHAAARHMEMTLDSLRQGRSVAEGLADLTRTEGGDTVRRSVRVTGTLRSVSILVRPRRRSRFARPDTFSISSGVYLSATAP